MMRVLRDDVLVNHIDDGRFVPVDKGGRFAVAIIAKGSSAVIFGVHEIRAAARAFQHGKSTVNRCFWSREMVVNLYSAIIKDGITDVPCCVYFRIEVLAADHGLFTAGDV